jgi:Alpha-glucosidases, family 31 of glycosyl hydrolases
LTGGNSTKNKNQFIAMAMKLKIVLLSFLLPAFCFAQAVKSFRQDKKGVIVTLNEGTLTLCPLTENSVRVKFYKGAEDNLQELVFTSNVSTPAFKVQESATSLQLKVSKINVAVDKQSGKLSFFDATGKPLVNESAGSRKLEPGTIQGEPCFMVEQTFESPANEAIFGLGQFQDGHYNLRGAARRLTQVNTQISIPFIYSSRGYGLLWHQYGLTDFNPADNAIALSKQEQAATGTQEAEVTTTAGTQKVSQNQSLYNGKFSVPQNGEYSLFLDLGDMGNRHFVAIDGKPVVDQSNMWLPPTVGALVQLTAGEHQVQVLCKSDNTPRLSWKAQSNTTTFRSPVAKSLDYVVFVGSADDVIAAYRKLSGNAPLFPKWAYGFWQCRERYSSGKQLVETIEEFRKRSLPVDVIVQDWQYWGDNGWGVPKFDEKNYPNPKVFIGKLHDLNAHFNISIWSNPDKNSDIGKEFVAKNRFIPNTKWLDYFNPETRKDYWNVLKTNMFDNGVDSWWMDAVEPENDALKGEKTTFGIGDFYRLTYPYFVSKSVYEGQRATSDQKRVCILTRSAYLGQQRYGIINWSGDIGGTWDTFKRQIVAGLNYSITGFPYWTTDIGGFFRPGRSQYTDEKYQELLTRWFQWGVFNPVFRIHGYMTETEPWKYGQTVEDNMRKALDLRYCLMPYIYSEAWQITKNGSTLMRPLVMDFCNDASALQYPYEYMFGKSLLVAPVTEAGAKEWKTYLPQAAAWYDFQTGETLAGGKETVRSVSLDMIPVYVKAGTILPIGSKVQYATEKKWDDLEIRVYPGANGSFTLYEDENDTYNYEKGVYSTITFKWDDKSKILTIADRKGTFPGMLAERKFHLVKIAVNGNKIEKEAVYKGKSMTVKF